MKIFAILALITASTHADGIMNIKASASHDVDVILKFGFNDLHFPLVGGRPTNHSFNPSYSSPDKFLRLTVGLLYSNESSQDVLVDLIPQNVEENIKFNNVTITLHINYTCNNGLVGWRCEYKNVFPTSKIETDPNLKDTQDEEKIEPAKLFQYCAIIVCFWILITAIVNICVYCIRANHHVNVYYWVLLVQVQRLYKKRTGYLDMPAKLNNTSDKDTNKKMTPANDPIA